MLKLTALVVGGTSIIFALIVTYSYIVNKNNILRRSELQAKHLVLSLSRKIEQEFRAVTKIPQTVELLLTTSLDHDESALYGILRQLLENNKEIYGISAAFEPFAFFSYREDYAPYFFRDDKNIRFEELDFRYAYRKRDWYHIPKILEKPLWSEPYYDEGGGRFFVVTYSSPIFVNDGPDRSFRGVVAADLSLNWLNHLLSSIQIEQSGFCFIVSPTGAFISHPDSRLQTKESLFSLAEENNLPQLRSLGRAMAGSKLGFVDIGTALSQEPAFVSFARIPSPGWTFAAVFPKHELLTELDTLHRRTLIAALVWTLLLLIVSIMVSHSMSKPLKSMVAAAGRISRGEMDIDLSDVKRNDEIGRLAEAFSQMAQGLKDRDFIRDTFGRYLTKEIVNKLLESKDGLRLGGETREITMMMSDLRGFTALTEKMEPEQVITFLNSYLGKMVEILIDHRGTIDEILGDGILAFFGAPEHFDDHAAWGVACALNMQNALEVVNKTNEELGFPRLQMGIAINTGNVVVGNIGSERRAKYGAVGSQVNITGRMEALTYGGQVLISQSTYEKIADVVEIQNTIEVEMKGISGTTVLYDVTGIKGDFNIKLVEKTEKLKKIQTPLPVSVHLIKNKTLCGIQHTGYIEMLSGSSAAISIDKEIPPFQDVKLIIDDSENETNPEIYAKSIRIEKLPEGRRVIFQFTLLSGDAQKLLRKLL